MLERLNRGLVTSEWLLNYPNSKVFHLPNYHSDHLPILLRMEPRLRRGLKAFRIEEWWYKHPDFKPICEKAVSGEQQSWSEAYSLLHGEIRLWSEGRKDPN